jgi:senataxin
MAILDATTIHSSLIIATALQKNFNAPEWEPPRKYARRFLLELLAHDIQQIHEALISVASLEKDENATLPSVSSSYGGLWQAVREALRAEDLDGYEFLLQAISKSALLVPLSPARLSFKQGSLMRPKVERMLQTVNSVISQIHRGFDDIILRLVDVTSESNLILFCRRKTVGSLLVTLLLSPIKSLSDGAQTLIGQCYNADGRVECLRVLLENQCDATLEAIISQLESFNRVATKYLDAVDAAKVLVRCYTDILDVLCAIDGGLLFDEQFITRNKRNLEHLPRLWGGMCKAAGIIIERTPDWAMRYQQGDMTPWMRDALIFGNELVEKRRVFESVLAASTKSGPAPKEGNLVDDLSLIMRPLVSWLRLTHQELLDLSYNLLKDLFNAFKDTKKQPEEKLLQFLEGFIKKLAGKKKDATSGSNVQQRTRLSTSQLGTLLRLIADLLGDEDSDIEFVSQVFSPKKQALPPAKRPMPPLPKPLHRPVMPKGKGTKTLPSGFKPGTLIGKLQKEAMDGMIPPSLNAKLVQSAIAERKAGKSKANLTSSSGGEPSSSSSESDSAEENAPSGLAQLSKLQKSPIKQKKQERKRTILLNDSSMLQTAGKLNQTTAERHRQIQKQQIRYIPDLTPLHRIILNWDYDYDGPEPPTTGGSLALKPVPDKFSSYRHYLDIMHPLLVVECWNSLVKSKEEPLDKVSITVAGKMHADTWVEIDAVIDQSVPKGWMLLETDIVLMAHATGKKALAKVHSSRQTRQGIQATIRYSSELNDMDLERAMTLKSSWLVSRVFK